MRASCDASCIAVDEGRLERRVRGFTHFFCHNSGMRSRTIERRRDDVVAIDRSEDDEDVYFSEGFELLRLRLNIRLRVDPRDCSSVCVATSCTRGACGQELG